MYSSTFRDLGAREILRPHVDDFLARVADACEPRVAGVHEKPVLIQQHDQGRIAAEQPLIPWFLRHHGALYGFSYIGATKYRN